MRGCWIRVGSLRWFAARGEDERGQGAREAPEAISDLHGRARYHARRSERYDGRVDPYRGVTVDATPDAPRDAGIVGDVIAQFADPFAFYRELVQNAIDAGTSAVEVRIDHDADVTRIAVRDRGEGMTRDVVENQLLVLFRSTKERDATKIGKFGIGFASVLAPNPRAVTVQTARGGARLVVHLYRDLTYQLYDGGPATQSGTTVELELAMQPAAVDDFVAASRRALERWCRHASVPIELHAPNGATFRIDRPLALDDALIEVRGGSGTLQCVVGVARDGEPYAGFFNHGLTLFETREPLLGGLAFKVQDARLGHTLSRDNVRRDEHFRHAVEVARGLAERDLPIAAGRALKTAAAADDDAPYRALVQAVAASGLPLAPGRWWFPLVEPLGSERAISGADLPARVWTSERANALTALLAARGEPVLRATEKLATLIGAELIPVERELVCVAPVTPTDDDTALLAILRELLDATWRAPTITLARLTGAARGAFAIAGDPTQLTATEPYLLDRDRAAKNPFARFRAPPLVLDVDHPSYRGARAGDPRITASHLARQLLLQHRLLEVARSTTILERTLDAMIGDPRGPQ